MILYYTGTGNSKYVAKRLAVLLDDTSLNLFDKLRNGDTSPVHSNKPFVIVAPTYGWQIPHLLRDWLKNTPLVGCADLYFVMTCGGDIGNAANHLARLCKTIGMNFKGCAEVVMPENYIALFNAPDDVEAREIIRRANPVIDRTANLIAAGKPIPAKHGGISAQIKSGPVNTVFYSAVVHAKKFLVSDACIGCGKCVKVCVMNNIRLDGGKPVWGGHCTHCMACICGCPAKAIEYGKASIGKPRYQCPEKV